MVSTLTLIAKQTVGANGASSVTFSNIPQTYTDLKVVYSARTTRGSVGSYCYISFNGSASNFSGLLLGGYGTGTTSASQAQGAGVNTDANATANTFNNTDIYIPNYTSTTTAKSFSTDSVSEDNSSTGFDYLFAGLWNPGTQVAITSLTLTPESGGTFVQYSTFYLYGISNSTTTQNTTVPYAYGGDVITTDGSYWYHAFKYSGSFTPLKNLDADILVVAGGGGSSNNSGGGGGAGGLLAFSSQALTSATNYTCQVGAGGSIGAYTTAGSGGNSKFGSLTTALGGGGGGGGGTGAASGYNGGNGGSGGGAGGGYESYGPGVKGTGTAGQGNDGGAGAYGAPAGQSMPGGGGGGKGAVGANSYPGNGGIGTNTYSSWASATSTGASGYYAGGGGGGGGAGGGGNAGTGGLGGGGAGANGTGTGTAGTANTGGGAGGGGGSTGGGGGGGATGGSGIIIVRYAV